MNLVAMRQRRRDGGEGMTEWHVPLEVGSIKYRFMNSIIPLFFLFIMAHSIYIMLGEKMSSPDKLQTACAFTST